MPGINPEVLSWARETAGLDLVTAARKIALNRARGISGADRLAAFEAGEGQPPATLLKRMAKQYRRPLITFFMPYVPRPAETGQDFRSLSEGADPSNALLAALLRDVKARQSLVREALEQDEEGVEPVTFVGFYAGIDEAPALSGAMVDAVGFDRGRFRAHKNSDEAFVYLRTIVEKAGVYVLLAGDCGSWQTAIEVAVFRGFALADKLAPFIVINDQDARAAWSFTLLHELAHLLKGASGVSGGGTPADGVERLCNDAASLCLVAEDELRNVELYRDGRDFGLVSDIANRVNVSRTMIAYRLFRNDLIAADYFEELKEHFRQEWLSSKEEQRERNREREGGPDWYVVRRHRLGSALLDVARQGLADGSLTPVRAARMLGVRPVSVYPLLAAPAARARSA